jgi:hypothetical protein
MKSIAESQFHFNHRRLSSKLGNPLPRVLFQTRSAQFNLFALLNILPLNCPHPPEDHLAISFPPVPARFVLSHTVKELLSRGLKSRSGGSHHDRHPVSRPPSFVAARKASSLPPHPSIHFGDFFEIFSPLNATHSNTTSLFDVLIPKSRQSPGFLD